MIVACLDLEGVLVPEIWINVAEQTGIADLALTTRDIADYDELMGHRLRVLDEHGLGLADIQRVIAGLTPLPGAPEFLDWLRERFQVIILSDTFYQFADPLMVQLGRPTLFCHDLEVTAAGRISGYRLRMADQKRHCVAALQQVRFACIAAGDSHNDTSMLGQADEGIFFNPPRALADRFPQYPVAYDYAELRTQFLAAQERITAS
ncbi:bifunctional phosphoserine phosphatase/homoserine phosphotransferase ThrH [Brooklawnia cerclae]|uniref:phosphoserine phosphatase n=1 Tax=Brooklawnia cerclae TaxID=349934 RepID=A0ABX0SEM9_9ACTN|nr:bifunctional phosphoserine phosphatase/homoserine phosphotransferase ThrH [Brooklawnia cerclae]NIH56416.1 phosphoserine/homoserine phosphotransferase [Brooklawnia cerclae]